MRHILHTLPLVLALLLAADDGTAQEAPSGRLTLSEAIEQAVAYGARTRRAGASRDAASRAASLFTSAYLPRVSAGAQDVYSQYPVTVTPIREPGVFPPLDDNTYELSVNASWTVFDFGRGRAGRRAAQALAEASGVQYELARMETIEAVTSAFIQLARLKAVEQAQRQRLSALRVQQAQLGTLFDEGRVAHVDVLKVDEVVLEAQTDLRATERQQENVLHAFAAEMGREQVPAMDEVHLVPLPAVEEQEFAEFDASVDQAPRVAAAEARLAAEEAKAREATRTFFPAIELFGTEQMRSGSDFGMENQWMAGVRLEVPIVAFGLFTRREVQEANVREQEAALADARRQVRVALAELNNQIHEAADRMTATAARVQHLDEAYRIESAAYEEGRLTLTDLLTTEARLAAGRSALIAARASLVLAHLRRSVLTGRLTSHRALQLTGVHP